MDDAIEITRNASWKTTRRRFLTIRARGSVERGLEAGAATRTRRPARDSKSHPHGNGREPDGGWRRSRRIGHGGHCNAELEAQLSRYRADGEVGRLNTEGRLDQVGNALLELLALAQRISALSDGAFDITIQPVLGVYRRALAETQTLPSAGAIADALTLVDYR